MSGASRQTKVAAAPDIPTVLFVSHDLGGGVERHLDQLEQAIEGRVRVARLLSQTGGYSKLCWSSRSWYFHQRDQFDDLLEILRALQVNCIHFHHLCGFLANFWQLPLRLDLPYRLTLHDFSLINGTSTLADADGFFMQEFKRQQDPALALLPNWCADLTQWQHMNVDLLRGAQEVYCPSAFTRRVYAEHYPAANYRQCYHPDWESDAPYPPVKPATSGAGKLRVAVLGMLGREKGADRLEACAQSAAQCGYPIEFVLFGRAYRQLHDSVRTLGPYRDNELDSLLLDWSVDLVWFPATLAESYSYTLSHSLRLGLPVLVPDVGAFAERTRGRPLSFVYPYRSTARSIVELLNDVREQLRSARQQQVWVSQASPGQQAYLYGRDYPHGIPLPTPRQPCATDRFDSFASRPAVLRREAYRTQLLKLLLRLQSTRAFTLLQSILPYGLQKRVKRWLSSRPLHELER